MGQFQLGVDAPAQCIQHTHVPPPVHLLLEALHFLAHVCFTYAMAVHLTDYLPPTDYLLMLGIVLVEKLGSEGDVGEGIGVASDSLSGHVCYKYTI